MGDQYKLDEAKLRFTALMSVLMLCLVASPAGAKPPAASRNITIIDPPPVLADLPENSTVIFGIVESVDVTLASSVMVDASGTGDFDLDHRAESKIRKGTRVNSFLLHFNPVEDTTNKIVASIEFPGEILGVIFTKALLIESNASLGSPSTDYRFVRDGGGFDSPRTLAVADFITDMTANSFSLEFNATNAVDQIRVVTMPTTGVRDKLTPGTSKSLL